jgi:hypothetical protein
MFSIALKISKLNFKYFNNFYFILDESILIVFIDYGNSETKPANEIYPMQESLARLPAMTVACTLAEASLFLITFFLYTIDFIGIST